MALTAMEKRVIDAFVDGDPEPPRNRTSYEIRHQPVTVRGRTIEGTQLRGPMNSMLADRTPDGMIIWVGTGGTRYQDSVYRYLKKTVPARIFEGHESKLSRNPREDDIAFETEGFFVAKTKSPRGYTVFVPSGAAATSDSTYPLTEDGLSVAIARCKYLAKRGARLSRNGVRKEWKDSNASNIYADLEGGVVRVFYNRRLRRWQIEGSADGTDLWVKNDELSFATAELAQEFAEANTFDYAYTLIEASEDEAGLD